MVYSKDKGWYFIHVPKNAGTSFVSMFTICAWHRNNPEKQLRVDSNRKKHGIKILPHSISTYHNKASFWQLREETSGLDPVAILRNPWSRALSLYLFNLKITQQNLDEDWGAIDHPILTRQGFKNSWMDFSPSTKNSCSWILYFF